MKNRDITCLLLLCLSCLCTLTAQTQDRWKINHDGSITWNPKEGETHQDHIEMSGLKVSTVVRYGVDEKGTFTVNRSIVWPMLRTIPNDTHASLIRRFAWNIPEMISVNGQNLQDEKVETVMLNGLITVNSVFKANRETVSMTRILFPSTDKPAFCEKYVLRNSNKQDIKVEIPQARSVIQTEPEQGVDGSYRLVAEIKGGKTVVLKPNEEITFSVFFSGYKPNENELVMNVEKELKAREALVATLWNNLILDTPDPVINTMFAFAKIRGAESIYDTKGGLMHGPGGESYYAAIWANDQAEYINPFFPYLGYETGNQSALCSFKHFARFMNPEYKKIPSSIIAEGLNTWGGAGDRGDAAMVAYGAARYALARGNKEEVKTLWPLIEWCLEYNRRQLNPEGVVASDADELEGRFPAGKANLCTSSLYYDALLSAYYLGKEIGISSPLLSQYKKEAGQLKENINRYFGGEVEGFDTYRYYKGNDKLRSWICIPLTVGLYDRKEETIKALFSPHLWSKDGLLTESGSKTFWDRSTLYALRGVYACGEAEKATEYLKSYSNQRLLGDHVPYAIEAWPEGNQRHLSAESGLYGRIVTEGMFGIRPTGLRSFTLTPHLPESWDHMSLRNIRAFETKFDVEVKRMRNGKNEVSVLVAGKPIFKQTIKNGKAIQIRLPK
ncbi:hypothetical protein [Bacteroides sp.]|uniref:hypothetical protein n=1 Tax=Bacteroides sp. TaxID=29523 RepID=UPI0026036F02|nr:hypothetical protein [Bacteroides sp.]MDD3036389.1 hypothetical protein [Bacteroides sp.]